MPASTTAGRTSIFGFCKQVSQGTPLPPSAATLAADTGYFARWLDGSFVRPDAEFRQEWEGDGSRGQSLNYKTRQNALGKLMFYPRPREMSMLWAAFSGTGSDATPTGGWKGTTTAVAIGASGGTLTATAPSTLTATITGTSQITVDYGTANAETVTLATLNTSTGVYTISGTFAKAHAAAAPVLIPWTHVITPQLTSNQDLYTLTMGIGTGATGFASVGVDAICTRLNLTAGAANPPLKVDADWLGLTNAYYATPPAASLVTDGPYSWFTGTWSIATSLVGSTNQVNWQAAVKDINLTLEAAPNPQDFIAESITPLKMIAANLRVTCDITLLWQDAAVAAAAFFNNAAAGTNTTASQDSSVAVQADLNVSFQSSTDTLQTFKIDLPNLSWTMQEIQPQVAGTPVEQKATAVALRASGAQVYTATVLNSNSVAN